MTTGTPLGGGAEFDRIRAVAAVLGTDSGHLGDDCAFLPDGWCVSTDVSVDEVHFHRAWLEPDEIGWRAAAAALSDLAAVGASADALLVAIVLPATDDVHFTTALMRGVAGAAHAVGAQVVGGDMSRGGQLAVSVTVLGRAGRAVRRAGARAGDGIWVTGRLGGARAALEAWRRDRAPDPQHRTRFARPMPRIDAGKLLAAHGATAMLDLSDGLAGDLGHLAAASELAVEVELDRLPVEAGVPAIAALVGESPQVFAAVGGEDYELLVTLPAAFQAAGVLPDDLPLTRIGRVIGGTGVSIRFDGRAVSLSGFSHFR